MNRRKFLSTSALTVPGLAFLDMASITSWFTQQGYKFVPLRGDVGYFTEQGGTIGWLMSKDGIAVVDSEFPDPAKHLIAELKKNTDRPFRYLINTHHHGDHTGGNIAFKGIAEHVIGHANCLKNHRAVAASEKSEDKQLFADTIFNDQWKTKLGSENISARYFGAAHTDGDVIVHFEDANVAHMGDLMFNKRYPFIDRTAGANIQSWITVLEKALSEYDSDTLFIFGHAFDPEKVTGGKTEIRAMQNYLDKLLTYVRSQVKAGKSKEEIMKTTVIPGAEDYKGDGIGRSLTAAYEEVISTK